MKIQVTEHHTWTVDADELVAYLKKYTDSDISTLAGVKELNLFDLANIMEETNWKDELSVVHDFTEDIVEIP